MTSDRAVLIVVIAALVAERLWSVTEPKAEPPPVQERGSVSPEHVHMPARLYVRRCAAKNMDFVIHEADGGPMKAFCVRTPGPVYTSDR